MTEAAEVCEVICLEWSKQVINKLKMFIVQEGQEYFVAFSRDMVINSNLVNTWQLYVMIQWLMTKRHVKLTEDTSFCTK